MRKFLAILLFLPLFAAAQERSTMRFDREEWDFGTIREVDGPVERTFTFTNTGRIAFAIEKVGVSCGCTTPVFSKEPVEPGKTGTITVRFDPKEKQGRIEQDIRIASKGGRNRNVLTIRGYVVPRPHSIDEDYPFAMSGGLRLSRLSLDFGYVEQGMERAMTAGYINTSPAPVTLKWEVEPARGIMRVDAPTTIPAGERGELTLTYDLRRTPFYGRYSDRVYLTVNGRREMLPLSTTFTAVDVMAEGDDVPEAAVAPLFHHHGAVRRGEQLTRTVELANDGRRPLIVRWVYPRAGMTTSLREGTSVAPGQTVEFTVTIDTAGLPRGVATGAITIITNDPIRPVRDIRSAADLK